MISAKYPWIQINPDACHWLSLLCKDVSSLDCFTLVSNVLKYWITAVLDS